MTSHPGNLPLRGHLAARTVTAQWTAKEVVASSPAQVTRPWFQVPEPTIAGIGVGEPTAVWTPRVQREPTRTLAIPAALQEQTAVDRPISALAHGARGAGLEPRPVPVLAASVTPALLSTMPVLEREVFSLARRIALQADLSAAMRVLQPGLSQLTDSPDVTCVFFDAALCSPWVVSDGRTRCEIDEAVWPMVGRVAGSG